MKKFSLKFFAFCVFGLALISLALLPACADAGEAGAGGEVLEEKAESELSGDFANRLAYFIGSKIADVLDEIAGSVERRTERKNARREQKKREKFAEMSPEDREAEERLSEGKKSLASGFTAIFTTIFGQAADSVRKYLEENILPKLKPKDLLVNYPRARRAIV